MADKKTRVDLENLFSSGKIPTQSNFADLIASGVNQKDDGLQKATDTPLKIQAPVTVEADAKAPKDLILFYDKLEDDAAKWRIGTRSGGLEISRGAQPDFLIDANGNVGIGTTEPKAKLHVAGDARIEGNINLKSSTNISSAGRMHISGEELLYLLNKSGVVVGKEWGGNGNLNVQGNIGIGIGTNTPGFPLTFANVSGDKISLSGQSGNSYGFGIQSALLQIHTDTDAADIAFGSGSSGSFKETMRVKGNGKVGIGATTINGVFDVQGKMYVKDNGTIEVPGSKNTFNGMIETFYGNNDRYGIGQFKDGAMAMYTSEAYAPSSIQFGLMTGDSSFKSQVKIDHNGNVGIGTDPSAKLEVKGRIKDQTGFVMPVGSIVAFGGNAAPDGWLLCNGQAIPAGDAYSELKAVLGQNNVPDLSGRTLIGVSGSHPLKQTGGAETHTLTVNEMPSHNHAGFGEGYPDFPLGVVGPNNKFGSKGGKDDDNYYYNTTSTGGGAAHNNMQPFYVVNYIIKY
jgi:microcystin-dependent protein